MICVVRALGVGMEVLSGLGDCLEMGCDLPVANVVVGMGVLSGTRGF